MNVAIEGPVYAIEAESRASALRHDLGLGSDAIADAFELLDHAGVEVVRWPMGEDGPDGFYVRTGALALAAVNSDKRLGRQRFTACHELGHHLFDQASRVDVDLYQPADVPERRANRFAAALLMPREGVRRWLDGPDSSGPRVLSAEGVVHLARHFGLSYEATLYRLKDLGYLRQSALETLRTEQPERLARRLGYDPEGESLERGRRVLPPRFVRLALDAVADGNITLARLGELLRVERARAQKLVEEAGITEPEPTLDELLAEARRA